MNKIRKAIFPVAGLGTRFLPATKSIPKEMLTILDRPIIEWAVIEAHKAGIEEMIFVISSNKTRIYKALSGTTNFNSFSADNTNACSWHIGDT